MFRRLSLDEDSTGYYNLGNRLGKCRTHLGISDGVILDNSVHRRKDVGEELRHIVVGQVRDHSGKPSQDG